MAEDKNQSLPTGGSVAGTGVATDDVGPWDDDMPTEDRVDLSLDPTVPRRRGRTTEAELRDIEQRQLARLDTPAGGRDRR